MPDMNDVQGELMDMIIADKSPSQISDRIKDMLFAKSAERVDSYRPEVAKNSFNEPADEPESPEAEMDGDVGAPEPGEVHPETGVPKVTNTAASVGGEGV
jgi:hypothetical protein